MDAIVTDMLRRSEWSESETIQNGDVLSCQIEGEIVECAVKIDSKEICVKLLRKDIELTASAKLMLMAPVTYTTGAGTRIANDRCAMRLKQLIVEQVQALNVSFSNIFNPVLSECTHCDNLVGVIQTLS